MKCFWCKQTVEGDAIAKYSCEHHQCYFCLRGELIKQQINKLLVGTETVESKCKCSKGKFEFPFISLKEINQCSYQKENDKCNEHKEEMYTSYCKGCKCLLCVECIKSHETTHEIISIEDYVNDVRNSLVNIKFKNFSVFSTQIEKFYTNFLDQINLIYNNDVHALDELQQKLNELREKIKNEKEQLIQREEIMFKLIRSFYSKAYDSLSLLQSNKVSSSLYYIAKQLSKIKFDISDFTIDKNDTVNPEIIKLNNEISNILSSKHLNAKIVYPYFGITKQFIKQSEFTPHSGYIETITYIPLTNQIATGSTDKCINIYSIPSYEIVQKLECHSAAINSIGFCEPYLISADRTGIIHIHTISPSSSSFSLFQSITDEIEEVNSIAVLHHSVGFIACSEDTTAKIWMFDQITNNFHPIQLLNGHEGGVTCAVEMDNNDIITGSSDFSVNIWRNVEDVEYHCTQAIGGFASGVNALCKYRNMFIVGFSDANITVFDIDKEGKYYELVILNEHRRMVNMMIGLKDDRFVSCSFDKKIVVWSFNQATKEFKRDQVLLEHKMSVTGVCETKEGKMISVGQDKKMIVWRRIKCA